MKRSAKNRPLTVLSNSEVTTHRNCGQLHHFAYVQLLRPEVSALPLTAGNMMHRAIAAGWRAAWSEIELTREERVQRAVAAALQSLAEEPPGIDPELEEARAIFAWAVPHYFEVQAHSLTHVPVWIEHSFRFRLRNASGDPAHIVYEGGVDLVLWDRSSNCLVVEDHKSTSYAIESFEGRLALDTQTTGYVVALREHFLPRGAVTLAAAIDECTTTKAAKAVMMANALALSTAKIGNVAFNAIRKRKPEEPGINLLKKGQVVTSLQKTLFEAQTTDGQPRGEVSVRQIDTTAEVYANALNDQFFERELPITEKQQAILQGLKAKRSSYCGKLEFFRGAPEIERWRKEIWAEAKQIRETELHGKMPIRNPGNCTRPSSPRCAYEALCLAPDDPVIRKSFRVALTKHEELSHGDQEKQQKGGGQNDADPQQAAQAGQAQGGTEAPSPVRF
jgi:hypothetical protein